MYRKSSIDGRLEPSSQHHLRMVWVRTGQRLGCRWVDSPTVAHLAPPPALLRHTGQTRLRPDRIAGRVAAWPYAPLRVG